MWLLCAKLSLSIWITSFVTANHTVNSRGKLSENRTVIRKLSFATPGMCRLIFDYCGAISALRGDASLVTAVRFSNGRKFLFIDCGDSKHACPALPILRDVITSISFRNGHKAPPKSLGHLRLREQGRQPLQKFAQKAPQPPALPPVNCPYISGLRAARTAGGWPTKHLPAGRRASRSDWAKRRFRRQPFILL